jgi:hypothetical protein
MKPKLRHKTIVVVFTNPSYPKPSENCYCIKKLGSTQEGNAGPLFHTIQTSPNINSENVDQEQQWKKKILTDHDHLLYEI